MENMKTTRRAQLALTLCSVAMLLSALSALSQSNDKGKQTSPAIVEEWFKRWNALDGGAEAVDRLVEMYTPDATHQIGPSERQIGPVVFHGHVNIRKMAAEFGKRNTAIAFRTETFTVNEKTGQLYHISETPWGGVSVSVEYVGAYTVGETKKRYVYPGAAFFQLQDGKILRARFYVARGEIAEVIP